MNTLALTPGGKPAKMTSLEIAELVESRHDSVKRTIERLANQGVIVQPPSVDEPGQDAMGRPRATQVYVFAGDRGKRDSIIVVAQLSPEFTARLVDRWQELEARLAAPQAAGFLIPQTMAEALRLAADEMDRRVQAENALALTAPKAAAFELVAADGKSLTFTQAAKVLGIKRDEMTKWMAANRWIYRQNASWVAYQQQIEAGRLIYKEAKYTDDNTGAESYRPYCHITPKGVSKLAQVFAPGGTDHGLAA